MPNPVIQWTVDQLFKQLNGIQARAQQQRAQISIGNAHVMDLDTRAQAIADPAVRAKVRADVHKLALNQGRIAKAFKSFGGKIAAASKSAADWMRSHGIEPSAGLAGLGLAPLVIPIAIIAAVIAATVAANLIDKMLGSASKGIALKKQLIDALLAGKISHQDYMTSISEVDKSVDAANQAAATDPFGIANIGKAALPIALIVGAIILVPMFMPKKNPHRRRRRYGYTA
jgi:hypothetical protein